MPDPANPRIHIHPELVHGILLGERAFAGVTKLRGSHTGSGWAQLVCFQGEGNLEMRHRGGKVTIR